MSEVVEQYVDEDVAVTESSGGFELGYESPLDERSALGQERYAPAGPASPPDIEELVAQYLDDGWTPEENPPEMDQDVLVDGQWLIDGQQNLTQEIQERGSAEQRERHDRIISDLQDRQFSINTEEQNGKIFTTIFYLDGNFIRHLVFSKDAEEPDQTPTDDSDDTEPANSGFGLFSNPDAAASPEPNQQEQPVWSLFGSSAQQSEPTVIDFTQFINDFDAGEDYTDKPLFDLSPRPTSPANELAGGRATLSSPGERDQGEVEIVESHVIDDSDGGDDDYIPSANPERSTALQEEKIATETPFVLVTPEARPQEENNPTVIDFDDRKEHIVPANVEQGSGDSDGDDYYIIPQRWEVTAEPQSFNAVDLLEEKTAAETQPKPENKPVINIETPMPIVENASSGEEVQLPELFVDSNNFDSAPPAELEKMLNDLDGGEESLMPQETTAEVPVAAESPTAPMVGTETLGRVVEHIEALSETIQPELVDDSDDLETTIIEADHDSDAPESTTEKIVPLIQIAPEITAMNDGEPMEQIVSAIDREIDDLDGLLEPQIVVAAEIPTTLVEKNLDIDKTLLNPSPVLSPQKERGKNKEYEVATTIGAKEIVSDEEDLGISIVPTEQEAFDLSLEHSRRTGEVEPEEKIVNFPPIVEQIITIAKVDREIPGPNEIQEIKITQPQPDLVEELVARVLETANIIQPQPEKTEPAIQIIQIERKAPAKAEPAAKSQPEKIAKSAEDKHEPPLLVSMPPRGLPLPEVVKPAKISLEKPAAPETQQMEQQPVQDEPEPEVKNNLERAQAQIAIVAAEIEETEDVQTDGGISVVKATESKVTEKSETETDAKQIEVKMGGISLIKSEVAPKFTEKLSKETVAKPISSPERLIKPEIIKVIPQKIIIGQKPIELVKNNFKPTDGNVERNRKIVEIKPALAEKTEIREIEEGTGIRILPAAKEIFRATKPVPLLLNLDEENEPISLTFEQPLAIAA